MKQLLITSVLATALASGSVLANPAAQQGDLDQIFAAQGKAGQVAALSHQEMQTTEGEWLPVIYRAGGGLAGTYGAGYGYLAGGGRSPFGFVGTSLAGGAAGVWAPVNGYRSGATAFGSAFTGGVVSGYGTRRGWW